VITWAGRVIGTLFAAGTVIWAAIAAREGWRRARRVISEGALDVSVRRHPAGGKLPGPGQPQASGVTSDEDTGVSRWTDEEAAYLRGEVKELPR
jgi:hypothetical protein